MLHFGFVKANSGSKRLKFLNYSTVGQVRCFGYDASGSQLAWDKESGSSEAQGADTGLPPGPALVDRGK